MATDKPHKSLEEQIVLLKSRGLIINDTEKTKQLLLNVSYYKLINGYGSFFQVTSDVYLKEATFAELYALYEFDESLKSIFRDYTMKTEEIINAYVTHVFAESYQENFAYLNDTNFWWENNKTNVEAFITRLKKILSKQKKVSNPVAHYHQKYNNIPIWVLSKYLDFGTIEIFFKLMRPKDRHKVVKLINNYHNSNYKNKIRFKDKELLACISNVREIRNVCSHKDRLIRHKCRKHIPYIPQLHDSFGVCVVEDREDVYNVYVALKIFLNAEEHKHLGRCIKNKIQYLAQKLNSLDIKTITHAYGFPSSWGGNPKGAQKTNENKKVDNRQAS